MAKGNDGNLLQHAVECEIVRNLQNQMGDKSFELIVTHGMAPFDRVTDTGRPATRLFRDWLDVGTGRDRRFREFAERNLPAVVVAYRRCLTTYLHYPNTGELVAAIVGRDRIVGDISEFDRAIADVVAATWQETSVCVHHGDWREHTGAISDRRPVGPWLMTMDPMTFDLRGGHADFLHQDFALIDTCVRNRLDSEYPGCFCLFCYSMSLEREQIFRAQAGDFANRLNRCSAFLRAKAANGRDHQLRHHVGMLISNDTNLLSAVESVWERVVAGPVRWLNHIKEVQKSE